MAFTIYDIAPVDSPVASTNWDGWHLRTFIGSGELSGSGNVIRIKFLWASNVGNYLLTSAYIGYSDATLPNYESTPERITYAGQNSFTVTSGEVGGDGFWSDPLYLAVDSSRNLILSFYIEDGAADDDLPNVNSGYPTNTKYYFDGEGVNYSDVLDWSDTGFLTWDGVDRLVVEKIEVLRVGTDNGSGEAFVNSIRLGNTLSVKNSVNTKLVRSGELFINSITERTTSKYYFKNSVLDTVPVSSTLTFQNRIESDSSGVNYGEYEYDESWGI